VSGYCKKIEGLITDIIVKGINKDTHTPIVGISRMVSD